MEPEDLKDLPVERRRVERRRADLPVPKDRRQTDRRANRLSPVKPFAGVAVVIDTLPLLRGGVVTELKDLAMRVAADTDSVTDALGAVGDRLDLAVVGATRERPEWVVDRLRSLRLRDGDSPPFILMMLERTEVTQLRALLAAGVEGVLDRTVGSQDLRAGCERLLAGQRVLAGGPMSVLASTGLTLATPPTSAAEAAPSPQRVSLTRKEREALAQLAQHHSNREIAAAMHVSEATVKTHLSNIYTKLKVPGRRQAVVAAVEQGLLA